MRLREGPPPAPEPDPWACEHPPFRGWRHSPYCDPRLLGRGDLTPEELAACQEARAEHERARDAYNASIPETDERGLPIWPWVR